VDLKDTEGKSTKEINDMLAAEVAAVVKTEPEAVPPPEPAVFHQDVELPGGKKITIEGSSEEDVKMRGDLAVKVAKLAAPMVTTPPEEPKKEVPERVPLTPDELFQLGLDLQGGKVEAVEDFLDKSGYLDRYFEKKGVSLDQVRQNLEKTVSQETEKSWADATSKFMAETPDYYPSKINYKLLGAEVLTQNAQNPKLSPHEAIVAAYSALRADGLMQTKPESEPEAKPEPEKPKKKVAAPKLTETGNPYADKGSAAKPELPDFSKMTAKELEMYYYEHRSDFQAAAGT